MMAKAPFIVSSEANRFGEFFDSDSIASVDFPSMGKVHRIQMKIVTDHPRIYSVRSIQQRLRKDCFIKTKPFFDLSSTWQKIIS